MKKQKKFRLRTMTDIKVFILFLLNNIGYPIDHTSVIGMVSENTEELLIDYDECLRELSEDGHLYSDDYGRELYYFEGVLTHYDVAYHCEYTLDYLFVFNPDGTYDVDKCYIELADKTDYFGRVYELKKIAEWNTPYGGE